MSYTLLLHPLVSEDYDEAYTWYEDQQKGLGERFIRAVRQTIEQIALYPEHYSSKGSKKFREALVDFFPYLVVYKVNKRSKIIYISSVHHTRKHPGQKYRQPKHSG